MIPAATSFTHPRHLKRSLAPRGVEVVRQINPR